MEGRIKRLEEKMAELEVRIQEQPSIEIIAKEISKLNSIHNTNLKRERRNNK